MTTMTRQQPRLLDGPRLDAGPESLDAHLARLGPLPTGPATRGVIGELEASGLLGRGGAGFPVGRKWRALADRRGGRAVVLANGAEGEIASAKDRLLMTQRPHLVIDGALLAAEAVGADDIVFYIGREHEAAVATMRSAIELRRASIAQRVRLIQAPTGYVAGEASAAVHYVNSADARPTTTPPRMSERGIDGRPTLVQNVESLAYAALIGRSGAAWYRSAGRAGAVGTALVTVSGAIGEPGVHEIELGTTIGELIADLGGVTRPIEAVILGGYFGTWARARETWELPLDPAAMRRDGLSFGCGIVGLLPADACGVAATAEIVDYLAAESAGQCGPCVFGLRAIADAMARIAAGVADPGDVVNVERWTGLVAGRGACRHPDGAAQLMTSALDVFGDDLVAHARSGGCTASDRAAWVA